MNDFIHIYPFFDNKVLFRFYYSFSPLRYWGGLYHANNAEEFFKIVLVPFDIGVVYIELKAPKSQRNKF